MVDHALDRFGRVDTLVNNAGIYIGKPFTEYTLDDYLAITAVNLAGFFHLTQRTIPQMVSRGSGHIVNITNKSLRALMTGLLGGNYSMNQASYDLTRLRRNGLITRIPSRNLYRLTDDGLAFAIFYTKIHNRVLRPLLATTASPTPPPLRNALRTIDQHINARFAHARLPPAAA